MNLCQRLRDRLLYWHIASRLIVPCLNLGAASAAFGLIFAFGMGWTNIIKKAEAEKLANLETTEQSDKSEGPEICMAQEASKENPI